MLDGSLSDTQTYAEVKPDYHSSYSMWLKHSNTAGNRLSEGDVIENMQIGSHVMAAARQNHKLMQSRANNMHPSVGINHIANQTGPGNLSNVESPYGQSPRMNRSSSIR